MAEASDSEKEETSEDWLKRQFEFELCHECNGDWDNHDVADVLGNPFAACKKILPPPPPRD